MSIPLELHLGLVRLNAELNNLQRAVQEVLACSGLTSGDAGPNDLAAKAQYLALEAAIRLQADRGPRIASSKQDDRSPMLRIAYPPGQRIGRDGLQRVLDAASPVSDSASPTNGMQTAALPSGASLGPCRRSGPFCDTEITKI